MVTALCLLYLLKKGAAALSDMLTTDDKDISFPVLPDLTNILFKPLMSDLLDRSDCSIILYSFPSCVNLVTLRDPKNVSIDLPIDSMDIPRSAAFRLLISTFSSGLVIA